MLLNFAKYVGSGNDFIIIDHRASFLPLDNSKMLKNLCSRHKGVGADGIILLEKSFSADFKMRIFNSDGFEAGMCGNGLRCLSKYVLDYQITNQKNFLVDVNNELYEVENHDDGSISTHFPSIKEFTLNISIKIQAQEYTLHYVNTGVPHVVLFIKDINNYPLKEIAPVIRYHSHFSPQGVNVNIAEMLDPFRIKVRTYERGVENETLSCGTGAVATAFASYKGQLPETPITIYPVSQEPLIIKKHPKTDRLSLQGNAHKAFQGEMTL